VSPSPHVPATLRALTAAQRRALVVLALLAVVVFALGAAAVTWTPVPEVDAATKSLVQLERLPWLERPMRALSALGSGYVLFPLGGVACGLLALRHRGLALALPLIGIGAQLVTAVTKYAVGRPRPNLRAYGYPSGHALGVMVFFGLAIYALWSIDAPRAWRRLVLVLAILVTPAVAMSRLYLNAHWATDILGGVAAGTAFVAAAILAVDRLFAKVGPGGKSSVNDAGLLGPGASPTAGSH
jgi:cation-transporting ATPase E